jgi:hypothetical protein
VSKQPAFSDRTTCFSRPYSLLTVHKDNGYIEGCVATRWGFVKVYSQGYAGDAKPVVTSLCIILNGLDYYRNIDAAYSERYLVTLAARFAEECAGVR